MKKITRWLLRSAFLAIFLATLGVGFAQAQSFLDRFPDCSGNGFIGPNVLVVIGLTSDQRLICFRANNPLNATTIGSVSGFVGGDTRLVGIDFRPAFASEYASGNFGALYGVGNAGGIYVINPQTGALRFVNRISVPLSGIFFGVDFNPAADRLRIISDTGQNLRQNVDPGGTTTVDTPLNYAMVTATNVTGAAYTNNDNSPSTGTTLYDIDTNSDSLAIQNPPNDGTLTTVGPLGVTTSPSVGFDIYTDVDQFGVAVNNRGFASLTNPMNANQTGFFVVDLNTGNASTGFVGLFSPGNVVIDVALPPRQRFSPFLL